MQTETASQHSPAPWEAERLWDGDYRITYNEAGNWLADVYRDGAPDEQVAADAALIAAAPELLAALKAAYEAMGAGYSWTEQARAAIAKAEGR